jgi:hypothetical protein
MISFSNFKPIPFKFDWHHRPYIELYVIQQIQKLRGPALDYTICVMMEELSVWTLHSSSVENSN